MSEREQAKQIINQLPENKLRDFDDLLKRLVQLERRIEELEKRTA